MGKKLGVIIVGAVIVLGVVVAFAEPAFATNPRGGFILVDK